MVSRPHLVLIVLIVLIVCQARLLRKSLKQTKTFFKVVCVLLLEIFRSFNDGDIQKRLQSSRTSLSCAP